MRKKTILWWAAASVFFCFFWQVPIVVQMYIFQAVIWSPYQEAALDLITMNAILLTLYWAHKFAGRIVRRYG